MVHRRDDGALNSDSYFCLDCDGGEREGAKEGRVGKERRERNGVEGMRQCKSQSLRCPETKAITLSGAWSLLHTVVFISTTGLTTGQSLSLE
jgi:hypothetical protein